MNTKKTISSLVALTLGASLLSLLAIVPVSAQTTLGVTSTATGVNTSASTRLSNLISKGDAAIAARLVSLNNLNTRVQSLKNVSATEKANISATVQTNISGLTSLKAKIDADTDVTTAATDVKSIFGSFRIYALVIPQGYIESSADRIDTIVGMMNTISAKLQTRISADQSAGKNVSAMQTSLADLNAKTADATTQSQTALSGVASLTPDQGNQTQLQSNTAALKASRADIATGTQDLKTARADAQSIIQDLKTLNANASTTVTQ